VQRRTFNIALIVVLLGPLLGASHCVSQQSPGEHQPLPTLTTARQAHGLTIEQAAQGYPVQLRAVVTYYDPYIDPQHPTVWVTDSSGGIYIELSSAPQVPFQTGDLLAITGVSAAGGYAPIVRSRQARVVGKAPLPPNPPLVTMTEILTGARDGQWVKVEGVVHAVQDAGKNTILTIALSDGAIRAHTLQDPAANYRALIDAKISLRGNQAPLFNHQGVMTGAYLLFPDRNQITIEEPVPPEPFRLPISPLGNLMHYTPTPRANHRVHVQGTVTLAWPGRSLCIQQDLHGLCAQSRQTTPLHAGDFVDVIGFPITRDYMPGLAHATYTTTGTKHSLATVKITADQAVGGDFDSRLVELEGQIIGRDETAIDPKVVLSSGKLVFSVVLPTRSGGLDLPEWPKGTIVKIVGVCQVTGGIDRLDTRRDGISTPAAFRILLRSADDVVVIKSVSWWTPTRAVGVFCLGALVGLIVLAWVYVLRKRVAAQTEVIRVQLEDADTLSAEIRALNEDLEETIAKRTAQLETANQELQAFSYSVSHDLRAPLRHIAGFSKILANDFASAMPDDAKDHLKHIQAAVIRMDLLVDGLLGLAKLGRKSLQIHPTDLNSLVALVLSDLQPECEGRAIEWRLAILPTMECDQMLVGQVFQNLLGNALKYSSRRENAIIEIGTIQNPGKPAVLFVRDNGAGFEMRYAAKLFGVFQRMHTESEFEGTGVGLATVHRIIKKHGGRIWAEAAVDEGATFYFTLSETEETPEAITK
jgi:signal transduction histidine kinase